jgi:hypothetical protein
MKYWNISAILVVLSLLCLLDHVSGNALRVRRQASHDDNRPVSLHQHWNTIRPDEALDLNMESIDHNIDLQQTGVDLTATSTTQFLNIDVKTSTCGSVLRRISYRLNFCVVSHGNKGTYDGSFKYFYSLSGSVYRLGQYVYTTRDCSGTATTQTLSRYGVSSTCGSLSRDSTTSFGYNNYYYSVAYATDDTSIPTTSFKYAASLTTGTDLGNPTSYGVAYK